MAIGLHFSNGWARVRYYGGEELDIPRYLYVRNAYAPPFEDLPSQSDYELAQRALDPTASAIHLPGAFSD